MLDGIVQQFISSSPGIFRELNEREGLAPDKVEAALEATLEGAVQEGSVIGFDLSTSVDEASLDDALRGLSSENGEGLTGRVTQYVVEHGFPEGVAEKVVSLALPKLLELAQKH